MKIIHLTDPHIVSRGGRLYGLDPEARLAAAIDHVNANHSDAAFALITGDLTHWGQAEAYDVLRDHLSRLRIPSHLLIGNHDSRPAFRARFPETPTDEDGFIQTAFETPSGPFILLDTHEPETSAGHLCGKRLAWLSRTLAAHSGGDVFIGMHHPPTALGLAPMDKIGLVQAAEFAKILAPHAARVRCIFFGHVHRIVSGAWRGIPLSTQRGLNHQVALTLASHPHEGVPGSLESPTYGVVLIEPDRTFVHTCDFLDPSPRFDLADRTAEAARTIEELAAASA